MPILSFDIKGQGPIVYASCGGVPELMIIAGPNGVGKSTLLEVLSRVPPNMVVTTPTNRRIYVGPHRVSIPYGLQKKHLVLGPQIRRHSFGSDTLPALPDIHVPSLVRSKKTPDYLHLYTRYSIARFKADEAFLCNEILYAKGSLRVEEVQQVFEPFREFIKYILPNLQFVEVRFEGENVRVIFKNITLGREVEFDDLSSGEKDAISLGWPLIEKQVENVIAKLKGQQHPHEDLTVIIDGLDQWLHPELQRRFIDYFRASKEEAKKRGENLQFIITTHSPTIVNYAKAEELYVMLFPHQVGSDGNQLRRIASNDEKLTVIREILGDITYLTFGKPILIVEGPEDKDILNILTKGEIEKHAIIRPLGGKGKIVAFVDGLKNIIPDLTNIGVRLLAVLDRNREDLKKHVDVSKQDVFFQWSVACIENLLLEPEAIYQTLKLLKSEEAQQKIRDPNDIEELLKEEARNLAYYEASRRIGELISFKYDASMLLLENDLKNKICEHIKSKKRRYDEIYRTILDEIENGEWRKTICAKELLRRVAGKFHIDYEYFIKVLADKYREIKGTPDDVKKLMEKLH